MKIYRDEFVAHLDNESTGEFSLLDLTNGSSIYLYEYQRANEAEGNCFHDAPGIRACFVKSLTESTKIYNSILSNDNT